MTIESQIETKYSWVKVQIKQEDLRGGSKR